MYGGGAARKNNGVVCVQRVKRVERSSTSRSRQRLQFFFKCLQACAISATVYFSFVRLSPPMEMEEGEKKIIIMVERCRSLNVSREKTIRYNVFSKCLYDRMKNNRGFKRRSIFFRSLFKFPPMREFVENKN